MYDLQETQLIQEAIKQITIRGADAKFVANLQVKIEKQLQKLSAPEKLNNKVDNR